MQTRPLDLARIQSLLSLGQIAAKLQRNPSGVWDAIKRLNIQPVITLPIGGSRYDPSVVDLLAAKMRRPNHTYRGVTPKCATRTN